jgi:hypothetical protein
MKRNILPMILMAAISVPMFQACKTSEENYRTAYEIAKAKKNEGLTQDEIAGFAREEAMPKTVYKGDSIPLKGMYVKWVEGGVDNSAKLFNVVVASFKLKFNATSVFKRMQENGYPNAVLLEDAFDTYYVGATTTASLDTAVSVLHTLQKASPITLRDPYPYILRKP